MRSKRLGSVAALAAGTLAVTGLAFAPTAAAVTPLTATITATCSIVGDGEATLTATQTGTAATITVTSTEITTPLALDQDTVSATLTLVKASGGTSVFSGTKNPAIPAGGGVSVGPWTALSPPVTAWRPTAAPCSWWSSGSPSPATRTRRSPRARSCSSRPQYAQTGAARAQRHRSPC